MRRLLGYRHLLAALADPTHPDHAEHAAWTGEGFDPQDFSVIAAAAHLAERFG